MYSAERKKLEDIPTRETSCSQSSSVSLTRNVVTNSTVLVLALMRWMWSRAKNAEIKPTHPDMTLRHKLQQRNVYGEFPWWRGYSPIGLALLGNRVKIPWSQVSYIGIRWWCCCICITYIIDGAAELQYSKNCDLSCLASMSTLQLSLHITL